MIISSYLLNDLSGVLLKYMSQRQIDAPDLLKVLTGYSTGKTLTKQKWLVHIEELAVLSNNPAIGLDLGQLIEPAHGGVMGYLALNCENLGEAFIQFERYQRIVYGDASTTVMHGNLVRVNWPSPGKGIDMRPSDECLLSGLFQFVRDITDDDQEFPFVVGFPHSEPAYVDKYQEVFGSHVRFDTSELYVEFTLDFFSVPVINNDKGLKKLLASQAESLLAVFDQLDDFEMELQQGLLKMLKDGNATLPALAASLGLTVRTLQRRLDERKLNFTTLLKDTRKELALMYLSQHHLSLTDISFLLAYSEQSAFTRAFKQWFGLSPKQYVKSNL